MLRNTIFVLVAAAGMCAAAPSLATAAGPSAGLAALAAPAANVEAVSFWARPYPYGYRWRPPACFRNVWVDSPWGGHWEHVRVCHR